MVEAVQNGVQVDDLYRQAAEKAGLTQGGLVENDTQTLEKGRWIGTGDRAQSLVAGLESSRRRLADGYTDVAEDRLLEAQRLVSELQKDISRDGTLKALHLGVRIVNERGLSYLQVLTSDDPYGNRVLPASIASSSPLREKFKKVNFLLSQASEARSRSQLLLSDATKIRMNNVIPNPGTGYIVGGSLAAGLFTLAGSLFIADLAINRGRISELGAAAGSVGLVSAIATSSLIPIGASMQRDHRAGLVNAVSGLNVGVAPTTGGAMLTLGGRLR